MALRSSLVFAALAASVTAANVAPFTDANRGWCYFCSNDGAPKLCNSQCETAINRICGGDLTQGWIEIEGDCKIEYFPPVSKSNAPPLAVTKDTCVNTYRGILNMCGKDAGDSRNVYDPAYCTTSGGGGTYGWNDDGSVMTGTGRYVIATNGTNQCGQHEASWHQATSIIQWNDSWVGPDDQVVLDTNPPPCDPGACEFPEPPPPNPECETEVCDIFDKPYYAHKGKPNWSENNGNTRHQIIKAGWAEDPAATELNNALTNRCHVQPYNLQAYTEDGKEKVDFEIPSNLCQCIFDAIFDASGGLVTDHEDWCEGTPPEASSPKLNDELRRRGEGLLPLGGLKKVGTKPSSR